MENTRENRSPDEYDGDDDCNVIMIHHDSLPLLCAELHDWVGIWFHSANSSSSSQPFRCDKSILIFYRISLARGAKKYRTIMQSVPTALIDAAAQGVPTSADNAPISMPPSNNTTWVM